MEFLNNEFKILILFNLIELVEIKDFWAIELIKLQLLIVKVSMFNN